MDDKTFNDQKTALDWIQLIEGERAKIRETDVHPRVREFINSVSPLEILDIGCGQGICSDKIGLNGQNYTGVEPSQIMIDRANELYPQENRKFVLGDIYKLPFSDDVFDVAFSVSVWHLLGDLKKAATELSRVLKDDGQFLIITANPEGYSVWTSLYTDSKQEGRRFEGKTLNKDNTESLDVLYLHTFDELVNSLQSVNLKILETETFRTNANGQQQYLLVRGQKF
jgi:SAM-dependent methyltransferase